MQNSSTYEMRVDFSDGFEVVRIDTDSIESAKRIALSAEGAISATCLARIDRQPQTFLAW